MAGIAFVIVIYFLGRSRRQRNHSMVDELEDDLPEFSAQNLDDVDEGVGEVRVVSSMNYSADGSFAGMTAENERPDPLMDYPSGETPTAETKASASSKQHPSIIVLYILSKPDQVLIGSQINSSAQAMGLSFGEMNIFHYKNGVRTVFSLANMLEPGSFDSETIHDLKTSGLTVFMELQQGDPLDDLTEMLQRSYQLAGLLDARLCNHKREPLTEQHAENYRKQVAEFIAAGVSTR